MTDVVTPERLRQHAQTVQGVTMSIQSLPENNRIMVCLRDIKDLTTKEVRAHLGIRKTNVKVRLHRARAAPTILLQDLKSQGQVWPAQRITGCGTMSGPSCKVSLKMNCGALE